MAASEPPQPRLSQPFTLGGVAGFARLPVSHLLACQLAVALLAAAAVVFAFTRAWLPPIEEAISRLPETGRIFNGRLDWADKSPVVLASGRFLALVVDADDTGDLDQAADLQLKLCRSSFELRSLAGRLRVPYQPGFLIRLNHPEVEPWWGAWRWTVLVLLASAVVVSLLLSWWCLSVVYLFPAAIVGVLAGREVSVSGCWKLAGAALMPGALLASGSIAAYVLDRCNLIQFLFLMLAHFLPGWIFVLLAPLKLPRRASQASPFAPPQDSDEPAREKPVLRRKNPFTNAEGDQ